MTCMNILQMLLLNVCLLQEEQMIQEEEEDEAVIINPRSWLCIYLVMLFFADASCVLFSFALHLRRGK